LIWEQRQAGVEASIWTICAGDPPAGELSAFAESLHIRWDYDVYAAAARRAEDIASCKELNVAYHHFSIPDCIYRKGEKSRAALYPSEESLFGEINAEDYQLVQRLIQDLSAMLPAGATLVCPLALGGHVDHKLVRAAVESLATAQASNGDALSLWYYPDYPYAAGMVDEPPNNIEAAWSSTSFLISEDGLVAWERSIAAHASQVSTFWSSLEDMHLDLRAYARLVGGVRLWQLTNLI